MLILGNKINENLRYEFHNNDFWAFKNIDSKIEREENKRVVLPAIFFFYEREIFSFYTQKIF